MLHIAESFRTGPLRIAGHPADFSEGIPSPICPYTPNAFFIRTRSFRFPRLSDKTDLRPVWRCFPAPTDKRPLLPEFDHVCVINRCSILLERAAQLHDIGSSLSQHIIRQDDPNPCFHGLQSSDVEITPCLYQHVPIPPIGYIAADGQCCAAIVMLMGDHLPRCFTSSLSIRSFSASICRNSVIKFCR